MLIYLKIVIGQAVEDCPELGNPDYYFWCHDWTTIVPPFSNQQGISEPLVKKIWFLIVT